MNDVLIMGYPVTLTMDYDGLGVDLTRCIVFSIAGEIGIDAGCVARRMQHRDAVEQAKCELKADGWYDPLARPAKGKR